MIDINDNFNNNKSNINTELKKLNDLILSLDKKKIIANIRSSMWISMLFGFDHISEEEHEKNVKINGTGKIYEIGNYHGITVCVDPYMKWDDFKILDENQNVLITNLSELIDQNILM